MKRLLFSAFTVLLGIATTYVSLAFCITLAVYPLASYNSIVFLEPIEIILLFAGIFTIPVVFSVVVRFIYQRGLLFSPIYLILPIISLLFSVALRIAMIFVFNFPDESPQSQLYFEAGLLLYIAVNIVIFVVFWRRRARKHKD